MAKYWINTVSRDHVRAGVEGSFTQANHGRSTSLRQLARGDLVAFYSPRTRYPDGEPLKRFTAVGRVVDDAPYQAEMTPTFHPWRRRVQFLECEEAPIQDLIGELTFIKDRKRWGFALWRRFKGWNEARIQKKPARNSRPLPLVCLSFPSRLLWLRDVPACQRHYESKTSG